MSKKRSNPHLMNKTNMPRGTTIPAKLIAGEKWTIVGSQIKECWWEFEMTPVIKKEILEHYNGDVNKWVDDQEPDYSEHLYTSDLQYEEDDIEYEWGRIVPQEQIKKHLSRKPPTIKKGK